MIKRYNNFLWVDKDAEEVKVYMSKYEPLYEIGTKDLDIPCLSRQLFSPQNMKINTGRRYINIIRQVATLSTGKSDNKMFDWVIKIKFNSTKLKRYSCSIEEVTNIILHNISEFNKNAKRAFNRMPTYDIEKYFDSKFKIFEFNENYYTKEDSTTTVSEVSLKLLNNSSFKYPVVTVYYTNNNKIYVNTDLHKYICIRNKEEKEQTYEFFFFEDFINSIVGD